MLPAMEPPLLDLHAATWTERAQYQVREDARKFETWESSAALRLGLGVAIDYALALGLKNIERRVQTMAALLRQQLQGVPGVTVRDLGSVRSGIVTFTHERYAAGEVMHWLRGQGVAVRTIVRSSARIDMEQRNLEELVRASVHYYNTEDEVGRFCQVLRAIR